MSHSTISLGLGLGGGKSATSSGAPGGGAFTNEYSVDFDGVDDYIACVEGGSDVNPDLSVYALSCWFKADSLGSNPMIVNGFGQHSAAVYGGIGVYANGDLFWNDGEAGSTFGSGLMSAGTWYNYLINYVATGYTDLDGASSNNGKGYRVYINGVRKDKTLTSTTWDFNLMTTTPKFLVGREGERPAWYRFNGLVDEVAIFGGSLSDADIAGIYNGGTPTGLTDYSPTLWWRMGDGDTFPTITDHGTGGNNGTMTNMTSGDIVEDVP